MKRGLLILFLIIGCGLLSPTYAKKADKPIDNAAETSDFERDSDGNPILPSIFIWDLPKSAVSDESSENDLYAEEEDYDTEEEITLVSDSTPVKGYIEYAEDADSIYLKDDNQEFVLNLSVPQKFSISSTTDSSKIPATTFSKNVYARSGDIAYNIAPLDTGVVLGKQGNFSFGTAYNESIDNSDLGFTTSLYTKYDRKYFSLKSSYNKESGVSYSTVIDKFSVAPEFKLNNYISIKDVMTSDITRNRKQNSLVLSIKPTKDDRVRFEFGAGQTFDESKRLIKSELKFSTQFNW